jgi:uncharacterized protein (TIGR02117 family)
MPVLLLLSGCVAQQINAEYQSPCPGGQQFYVIDHGWHTALVIEASPLAALLPGLAAQFPKARYLELGWGDDQYFRTPEPGLARTLAAALWPTPSVLHVAGLPDPPSPGPALARITTDEPGYGRLLAFIAASFEQPRPGKVEALEPGLYGNARFYRATGNFHLFNTCNSWVARAVHESGLPLPGGPIIISAALMRRIRAALEPIRDCPAARSSITASSEGAFPRGVR